MRLVIALILILLFVFACKQVDKLTKFDMEYTASVTIPSSAGVNLPFNLFTPDIESNAESTFAVNDTRKDLVEEIKLKKLNLTITSPPGGDFGFLKSIAIYISASGLPECKIAWKENIPDSQGNTLELSISGADLKEYIKKDSFKLRVNTVTDELIGADHEVDIYSVFHVDAKILGQ